MSRKARKLTLLTASFAVGFGLLTPGVAAALDSCNPSARNFCVFWGQNFEGAHAMWNGQGDDHNDYTYPAGGAGAGQVIGNNAGSFANFRVDRSVTVYYNPGRNGRPPGPSLHIGPNDRKNCAQAGPLICNNNRSHFYN